MFSSCGHLTFDPYISCKCQRLASTASKSRGAKYHRKIGFLMINPTKRGSPGRWGQENHSVYNVLAFLVILRSKRLSRSSRLLRLLKSSWLIEPMRPLRSSDSLSNLNLIMWWIESSYFDNINFLGRIMKSQVQFWHPSALRLWRTACVIYVKIDWWNSNAHCCWTCI